MKRAAPVILVAAAVVGLAGGIVYAWILDPIESQDSMPSALHSEDKLVYLAVIGDLYVYEGDLAGAEARLAELDVEADGQVLTGQIEAYLAAGGRAEDVRNLARLAEVLGASGGVLLVFASAPTPSPQPTATLQSQPGSQQPEASATPAPTITPVPSFRLVEQTAICADPGRPGLIAVRVRDSAGSELAGVEIVVSWNTGQDRFFTGLRPEKGTGYADFEMAPEVEYDVSLAGFRGEIAQGLTSDFSSGVCPSGTIALGWQVSFELGQ